MAWKDVSLSIVDGWIGFPEDIDEPMVARSFPIFSEISQTACFKIRLFWVIWSNGFDDMNAVARSLAALSIRAVAVLSHSEVSISLSPDPKLASAFLRVSMRILCALFVCSNTAANVDSGSSSASSFAIANALLSCSSPSVRNLLILLITSGLTVLLLRAVAVRPRSRASWAAATIMMSAILFRLDNLNAVARSLYAFHPSTPANRRHSRDNIMMTPFISFLMLTFPRNPFKNSILSPIDKKRWVL